ncbi:MAG: sterol desaturase family protein [Bacteroidota bacterium]|nr:sterol desaturase family protein [Bacteroidota bacterium]MDP4213567.1 sterol desaturase family protein [Bacteroidota bacterium]MDP4249529.1 sterol desaturase family protein [Bacteroidota bacterium]
MAGSFREQLLILISTPLYIIIIGLELLLSHLRHRKAYGWKDTVSNVYLMLLNALIDLSFRAIYVAILLLIYDHKLVSWKAGISYWVMLVLAEDFLYYWLHRFDHEVRLFWAVHVTHHSSELMNFTVGFRSSVFQPLYRFIYFMPLAWFGFQPLDIVFIYSATQIWGIFVHTEIIKKMGWLEFVLVTPSHHRVHHASNPKYLDKNMGMFLIVWDQLFGTFQPELPDEQYQEKKYGLTKPLDTSSPVNLVFHEWREIRNDMTRSDISWREKWYYLFGPPGWSHDGSRQTSRQLQKSEELSPLTGDSFQTP